MQNKMSAPFIIIININGNAQHCIMKLIIIIFVVVSTMINMLKTGQDELTTMYLNP